MFQAEAVNKIRTHFLCNTFLFFSENRVIHETVWKNGTARQATYDNIIGRKRFAAG